MPNPNMRGNVYLPLDIFNREKIKELKRHEAIVETYINETEGIAVVKYEKDLIDEDEVRGLALKIEKTDSHSNNTIYSISCYFRSHNRYRKTRLHL